MKSIEALKTVMEYTNNTQSTAATLVGWTKQQLNSRMTRGDMKTDEWLALLEAMGAEVVLVDKKTGEPIKPMQRIKGVGPRAKGMSERVKYDTEKADALANSFFLDGENMYMEGKAEELYIDEEGRYFLVTYTEDGKSKIHHVTANVAKAFIEKYGSKSVASSEEN